MKDPRPLLECSTSPMHMCSKDHLPSSASLEGDPYSWPCTAAAAAWAVQDAGSDSFHHRTRNTLAAA